MKIKQNKDTHSSGESRAAPLTTGDTQSKSVWISCATHNTTERDALTLERIEEHSFIHIRRIHTQEAERERHTNTERGKEELR